MDARKEKLPKGRSYPLKPSSLQKAIGDAHLQLPVRLTRWDYKGEETFEATFYPEGSWPEELCFWVSCGAAPSERVAEIRDALETECIPRFIQWAKEVEALDARSPRRREHQRYKWDFPHPEE
jgi:hypothetical protein